MSNMTKRWTTILGCTLATCLGCAPPDSSTESGSDTLTEDVAPHGLSASRLAPPAYEDKASTPSKITYHGGPVMLGNVGIYYIWYGNWSNAEKAILVDFASNLGGSSWWNINTTYTNGSGTRMSNSASFRGGYQYTGASGYSTKLSDSDIRNIVANTISQGKLPKASDAVYVVLTSKDVNQASGCPDYCGWHTAATISSASIKYAWVGNPTSLCGGGCTAQSIGPNGNAGVDGMVTTIAHELTEAATDPLGNAWYDSNGDENADKCNFNFGATSKTSSGAKYNITLGSRKYLVQQNWVNSGNGYCAMTATVTDQCPSDPNKTAPGICGCGKTDPKDTANYRDAQGYTCSDWQGYDCRTAASQYGYTSAQQQNLITNCPASCRICP